MWEYEVSKWDDGDCREISTWRRVCAYAGLYGDEGLWDFGGGSEEAEVGAV